MKLITEKELHEDTFISNYYIDPDFNLKNKEIKVIFLPTGYPGKTCYFSDYQIIFILILPQLLLLLLVLILKYWNLNLMIMNTKFRYGFGILMALKDIEILHSPIWKEQIFWIYLFVLINLERIEENFINEIKSKISKEVSIYVVGNKLDIVEDKNNKYKDNPIKYREKAKLLIENKDINNYFEISTKNKKEVDNSLNNIKLYILIDAKSHYITSGSSLNSQ